MPFRERGRVAPFRQRSDYQPKQFAMKYNIISPDGFPMNCEPFDSEQEALDAIPLLCKRYERQGYYLTAHMDKVSLEILPNYLRIVKA